MRRLVAVLVLLVPAAAAAPVDVYFHTQPSPEFPMNTQVPPGEPSQVMASGTSGCIEDPTGAQHLTSRQMHTWRGYYIPGPVVYDDDMRIYNGGGLAWDMRLLDAPVLVWHLEADTPLPQVVVEATLRTGNEMTHEHRPVARGASLPADLMPGMDHPQVTHHEVEGRDVYAFEFPLELATDIVAGDEAFDVLVSVSIEEPVCQEGYTMPDLVRVHQSQGLWNRLRLEAEDPVRARLEPMLADGVRLQGTATSLFGGHDVLDGLHLEIAGPVQAEARQVGVQARLYEYHHGPDPVVATWEWEAPAAGIYTVTFQAANRQGTAQASADATFEVGGGIRVCQDLLTGRTCTTLNSAQGTPTPWVGPSAATGPAALGLGAFGLGALGVAALAARRRLS